MLLHFPLSALEFCSSGRNISVLGLGRITDVPFLFLLHDVYDVTYFSTGYCGIEDEKHTLPGPLGLLQWNLRAWAQESVFLVSQWTPAFFKLCPDPHVQKCLGTLGGLPARVGEWHPPDGAGPATLLGHPSCRTSGVPPCPWLPALAPWEENLGAGICIWECPPGDLPEAQGFLPYSWHEEIAWVGVRLTQVLAVWPPAITSLSDSHAIPHGIQT